MTTTEPIYTSEEYAVLSCILLKESFEHFMGAFIEAPLEPMFSAQEISSAVSASIQGALENPEKTKELLADIRKRGAANG